ncbi:GNAT family N-acetyltransferase [Bowmanella dokdonensis]|uniref:GNAT family N-acetyltransferase n=1 Tax=Bowmanella dokdonensis TaxID=751969 RepID=A0A939DK81_9ALTE|nr:GNAT family N-acetyltransferase [Bowmanella dokdonensis]MBN7824018.1 GNAT family N-acetyltransferase [Bowmanella dokdonensis]
MSDIQYQQLTPDHFDRLLALANHVHGDNYLDMPSLQKLYNAGLKNDLNASWVALDDDRLVGFRLTLAAGNWQPDKWCSPSLWPVPRQEVCYFKCNTVDASYRAAGIGSKMLKLSVGEAAKQGAKAGLAHIWMASPGNSAFKYFSKCGGKLVKEHPGKWQENCINDGYVCPVCGTECDCVAAEMILQFEQANG